MVYTLDVQAYYSGIAVVNLVLRHPSFTKEKQPHDFGPTIKDKARLTDRQPAVK